MIRKLQLRNFKNFEDATLELGPLTTLIGTNASGKSNIRDAFRFLHGISRGYILSEILGEKWGEGGVLQWAGIRGGPREVTYDNGGQFEVTVWFDVKSPDEENAVVPALYTIRVRVAPNTEAPSLLAESLRFDNRESIEITGFHLGMPMVGFEPANPIKRRKQSPRTYSQYASILHQVDEFSIADFPECPLWADAAIHALSSFRFFDFSPESMRKPSFPGQVVLVDRGENLSSVLFQICSDPARKATLLAWVNELTPMDACDFDFPVDQIGRVLLTLVEEGGRRTSAYSASDGTLIFLGMLAALLGPEAANFYFFEELENGIHPQRLSLLLDLIEHKVADGKIQIVATSHSPFLLSFLRPAALEHVSLVYRNEGRPDAKIKRILDLPDARRIIGEQNLARLHVSGWFENAMQCTEEAAVPG